MIGEHTEGEERSTEEAWQEVGERFEALGESLAQAIRAAWEQEATQRNLESVRDGLQTMTDRIDRAVREASESGEARKLRREAEKAAKSARVAGEQTWREAQPHLLSALTRINAELERVIERMKGQETRSDTERPQDEPTTGGDIREAP